MNRLAFMVILAAVIPASALGQGMPGRPPGPPPGPPPGAHVGPPPGPPRGPVPLWPAGARVEQMFELHGEELEQTLEDYPNLAGVRAIRVVNYTVPGPPQPPEKILEFYARTLREPAWHQFFQSTAGGPDLARVAYRGPGGFISVIARPRGATATHIEGEMELSDMPALEKVVREAIARRERTPLEARDRIESAMRQHQAGKTGEAMAELRTVLADYPNAEIAHFNLARILVEQDRPDEAGKEFRYAIGLAPLNAVFRAEYARLLLKQGDIENAQYELQQAATIDPWSPHIRLELARLLENSGRFKEAEEHYRRIAQLLGNFPQAYVDLGRVLEKQGRKKDALSAYKDALKLKSDFPPARAAVERLKER